MPIPGNTDPFVNDAWIKYNMYSNTRRNADEAFFALVPFFVYVVEFPPKGKKKERP